MPDSVVPNNAFAKHSLLIHKRYPPTNDTVAANAQIEALIQVERMAVACDLRDSESMQDRCFGETAAGEIAVTAANTC